MAEDALSRCQEAELYSRQMQDLLASLGGVSLQQVNKNQLEIRLTTFTIAGSSSSSQGQQQQQQDLLSVTMEPGTSRPAAASLSPITTPSSSLTASNVSAASAHVSLEQSEVDKVVAEARARAAAGVRAMTATAMTATNAAKTAFSNGSAVEFVVREIKRLLHEKMNL